jgi:GAF domain-containing protein
MHSTPLVSRSGRLLGMISTHWCKPRYPTEHELRALDVLARQAADLIERVQIETAVRERDELAGILLSVATMTVASWVAVRCGIRAPIDGNEG